MERRRRAAPSTKSDYQRFAQSSRANRRLLEDAEAGLARDMARRWQDNLVAFEGFPPCSLEQFYRFFEQMCEDILRSVGITDVNVRATQCACRIGPDGVMCPKHYPKRTALTTRRGTVR